MKQPIDPRSSGKFVARPVLTSPLRWTDSRLPSAARFANKEELPERTNHSGLSVVTLSPPRSVLHFYPSVVGGVRRMGALRRRAGYRHIRTASPGSDGAGLARG